MPIPDTSSNNCREMTRHAGEDQCPEKPGWVRSTSSWMPAFADMTKTKGSIGFSTAAKQLLPLS
jgi:hypothetical protein